MFIGAKEAREKLSICGQTLYNWRKQGKIEFKIVNGRKFLYNIDSVLDSNKRKNVIYARVSNSKQKEDLIRQTKLITEYMIANGIIIDEIFEDVASGMNENRKAFSNLMNKVFKGEINKIYISYQDRLIRFGFKLIETIFKTFGTEIIVINATKEEDFQQELAIDLVSIIHHFSMKMYSNRRSTLKKLKKELILGQSCIK